MVRRVRSRRVLAGAPNYLKDRNALLKRPQFERHYVNRVGWLRAAVLGANDGIVSLASLLAGVGASQAAPRQLVLIGVAGLVAGALSMAAGEYVSVSSQRDAEQSDLERERRELEADGAAELAELAAIYVQRGLQPSLAHEVAVQLTAHDALGAHARDELGLSSELAARPMQAALASAASFTVGALLPLLVAMFSMPPWRLPLLSGSSLVFLGVMGAVAARTGGAPVWPAAVRVIIGGALAMGITAAVGSLVGAVA